MPAVPMATSYRRSTPIGLRRSEPRTIRQTTGEPPWHEARGFPVRRLSETAVGAVRKWLEAEASSCIRRYVTTTYSRTRPQWLI
jgi:hypothetical protein